ncbi:probable serine/threonine-protein kinase pats1 [Saccostrea cucullata]|uniref:probable serine/threonine-protein kinase pats1 n=1 Tax=Saccostrea cuccullata TaxID=36930 RepID=UPI002ED3106E
MHIENCFPIGFENNDETEGSSISKIEKSIVQTILSQKHWGEEIPLSWYKFEAFLSKEKEENKILSPQELFKRFQSNVENYISPNIDEMEQVDILQFFHEIGRILFFQEDNLRDYVILDVQWFVDAFKHVITDCNHMPVVNRPREWDEFNSTGVLHHTVLEEIWRYADCRGILKYKDVILPYMQRLGLLVIGEESHLIPSVTKREYKEEMSMLSTTDQKTLILYFSFDFLPLFVYHRLVVSCFSFKDWLPLQDGYKCIYKNVSEFKYEHHYIVLGVFKEDIYLQIYRPNMQNAVLNKNVTLKVRQTVEDELEKLSNSYHRKIKFETGFYCMTKENSDRCFIPESEMRILTSEICPHHESRPNHTIISKEYMWPWDKTVQKPAP